MKKNTDSPGVEEADAADRNILDALVAGALSARLPDEAAIRALTDWPEDAAADLSAAAERVRAHYFGDAVSLCGIVNARSGACSENCAFCAQSAHHKAVSPRHEFLPLDEILRAAKALRDAGATRFSLVTSGKRLSNHDFDRLLETLRAVSELGLRPDCSPGILDRGRLRELKAAGCGAYHHNLETGRAFFPRICTTHAYEEDVQSVRDAVEEGLTVCSGGIFGLGESWADRVELALELRGLGVHSVPVNFLHPVPGTPLADRPVLSRGEALKIVALFRFLLPDRQIRICGGRHDVFGPEHRAEPFRSGASGIMVGDYLTLKGRDAAEDRDLARSLGLRPESGQ